MSYIQLRVVRRKKYIHIYFLVILCKKKFYRRRNNEHKNITFKENDFDGILKGTFQGATCKPLLEDKIVLREQQESVIFWF